MNEEYRICSRCIMDNASDPTIIFDDNGCCNYCTRALSGINTTMYFPNEEGKRKIDELVAAIKKDGVGKKYDCAMGISGGLDSSYLLYLGHKWGLRILAVHIDDGFDTEISKGNIKNLCRAASVDLKVIKPDAKQFYDLTKAYLRAGVPNVAAPQDSVLLAYLYKQISNAGIHYFLSGSNFALECILQHGNTHGSNDVTNIKDIAKRFSDSKINKLEFFSSYDKAFYTFIKGVKTVTPLNYVDYNRDRAFKELADFCGFRYYGSKHLENILTAFIQLYWFPLKFNVDKRRSHLSSMIASGQLTRQQAIEEMNKPLYDEALMKEYIDVIKQKLEMSDDEFDTIMSAPAKSHSDYRTDKMEPFLRKIIGLNR